MKQDRHWMSSQHTCCIITIVILRTLCDCYMEMVSITGWPHGSVVGQFQWNLQSGTSIIFYHLRIGMLDYQTPVYQMYTDLIPDWQKNKHLIYFSTHFSNVLYINRLCSCLYTLQKNNHMHGQVFFDSKLLNATQKSNSRIKTLIIAHHYQIIRISYIQSTEQAGTNPGTSAEVGWFVAPMYVY